MIRLAALKLLPQGTAPLAIMFGLFRLVLFFHVAEPVGLALFTSAVFHVRDRIFCVATNEEAAVLADTVKLEVICDRPYVADIG